MNNGNIFLDLLVRFAPEGTPSWLLDLSAAGVGVGILVAMVSVIAMFCVWMERKVAGHIQCR
ncbi:MAG: hypothetical protein QF615_00535, partial [Planctomycetota bacterium]|nr:hypothetical protein [Planctomycetota bacterium]